MMIEHMKKKNIKGFVGSCRDRILTKILPINKWKRLMNLAIYQLKLHTHLTPQADSASRSKIMSPEIRSYGRNHQPILLLKDHLGFAQKSGYDKQPSSARFSQ